MLNTRQVLLPIVFLLNLATILAQKILIVDVPQGFNDLEDFNSNVEKYLQQSITDFTVPAADGPQSYAGFLTGKLQLKYPVETLAKPNLHSIASAANIPTAHFGVWPFKNKPETQTYLINNDPQLLIKSALEFINNKNDYLMTLFLPPLSDAYIPGQEIEKARTGRWGTGRILCWNNRFVTTSKCSRQPYVTMMFYKDQLLGQLLSAIQANQNAVVFWSPVHGGIDPHVDVLSAPRTKFAGGQYSLLNGGIRTQLRYLSKKLSARIDGNGIDIAPTLLSLNNLNLTSADGINLFNPDEIRKTNLKWFTHRRAEGREINSSPAYAELIIQNGIKYKYLYDGDPKNDRILPWGSDYELQPANIQIPAPNPRPTEIIDAFKPLPANVINNNLSNLKKPKIIMVILTDDTGYGDVGYFSNYPKGRNYPDTPNIDNLFKTGLVLTDFHTGATICTPTRQTILSGRHALTRGVYEHFVTSPSTGIQPPYLGAVGSKEFGTTFFRDQGWVNGHFGKWHVSRPKAKVPMSFYGFKPDGYKISSGFAPPAQTYLLKDRNFESYSSENVSTDGIAWMSKNCLGEIRCYLNLWYPHMHTPFRTAAGQLNKVGFGNENNPYLLNRSTIFTAERPFQIYNGLYKFLDQQLGRIFTWLRDNNLEEDTLIAFVGGDNGPENTAMDDNSVGSSGRFRAQKRSNYEGGHRMPTVIKWGNKLHGSSNVLSATYDLYLTLAGMAGYDVREISSFNTLDGVDLSPCLLYKKCEQFSERVLRWESTWPIRGDCSEVSPRFAVRWRNYSFLADSKDQTALRNMRLYRFELYDLEKDVMQTNNIAEQNPELVEKMKQMLIAWPNFNTKYWPSGGIAPHTATSKNSNMRVGFSCG